MTDLFAYEDGTALGGALSELFAADITAAAVTCRACGQRGRVAQLHLYRRGPGLVARCPSCTEPILRYVRTASAAHLDLHGTLALAVPLPAGT